MGWAASIRGRFPFAWYTAGAGTKSGSYTAQSLTAESVTITTGGLDFVVTPSANSQELALTNRAGEVWYYAGNNPYRASTDQVAFSKRVKSVVFSVKIVQHNTSTAATAEQLAAIADTYTITVAASGMAKASLVTTSAVGLGSVTDVNFADPSGDNAAAAEGVLGKEAEESFSIGQIIISNTGVVTYKVATAETPTYGDAQDDWTNYATAQAFATVYVGLEVTSSASGNITTAASAVTPSISGATSGAVN
ncbi:MAG: hypothetical protein IJU64_07075 [Bacilli bacterium]|nr:hypothetical protein [Bacilli bacterium]